MNIQSYAMPGAAYFFPIAYGDLNGANYWVWYLSDLFARRKFMTIFSMLFGAGVILMHERAAARGVRWAGLHYRRMGVLWVVGLIHAYIFWDGDILVAYAICGLFLYLFRRARPRTLLIWGLTFLIIGSGISWLIGWSVPTWPPENQAEFDSQWLPSPAMLAEELAAMRGDWRSEIAHRAHSVLTIHLFYLPFQLLWRAGGCMLLGMALYRLGWFSGKGDRRLYLGLIASGLLVGLPLTVYGIHRQEVAGWDPAYCFFHANLYGFWGSLPMALGYVGLVMLVLRDQMWSGLTRRLAAVGRMAFSNYLLQTLICTTLFYGHGAGLFGRVERLEQAAIVLAIWCLQLVLSPWWLQRFRFGPAEWVWRSLSYRIRQPFRNRS
jgi:uncharacterized protein